MFYGDDRPDKFGMTKEHHIQEFIALTLVFLMLLGCFLKVVFL